jgi:hypothetical protein
MPGGVEGEGRLLRHRNEAGQRYSTSRLGREEFPQHDATVGGRDLDRPRLQTPLSEFVKSSAQLATTTISTTSGHHLRKSHDEVVESCVNYWGSRSTRQPAGSLLSAEQLIAAAALRVPPGITVLPQPRAAQEVPGIVSDYVQAPLLEGVGGDKPLDAT